MGRIHVNTFDRVWKLLTLQIWVCQQRKTKEERRAWKRGCREKLAKKLATIEANSIPSQQFANLSANCFYEVHKWQLEFANLMLSTFACHVKAPQKDNKLTLYMNVTCGIQLTAVIVLIHTLASFTLGTYRVNPIMKSIISLFKLTTRNKRRNLAGQIDNFELASNVIATERNPQRQYYISLLSRAIHPAYLWYLSTR